MGRKCSSLDGADIAPRRARISCRSGRDGIAAAHAANRALRQVVREIAPGIFVRLAEPDKNFPEDRGVFLDLWHGEARDVRVGTREDAQQAKFVITGAYSRWKQVAQKELDATKGIMLGRLKLKGDFPTIVRYMKASQELTECTTRVPVRWPDEA